LLGLFGNVDGFLKIFASFLAFAHQIQDVSSSNVGGERQRLRLQDLAIKRERFFHLSFAHQLLTLLDEFRLLALGGGLRE